MYRTALKFLAEWKNQGNRKPLVIRGARQVGKSYLAKMFAENEFEHLAVIDFEQDLDAQSLFASKRPASILPLIEAYLGMDIHPGRTLLFLDEIQAAPAVFACLRYFHEQLPELHVIAAGSLLELALLDEAFSVPVGRIEYCYLGPMTFEEFLVAAGQGKLKDFLASWLPQVSIPTSVHHLLLDLLRTYLLVGGMPDAIRAYLEEGRYSASERVKQSILSTYEDDFAEYGGRMDPRRIRKVFRRLPSLIGQKLKYSRVDPDDRAQRLASAIDLLEQARVVYRVRHSSSGGIPLAAQADERFSKPLLLDVGLVSTALGLDILDFEAAPVLTMVNAGAVCEQFVGQHLLYMQPWYRPPALFYWAREKRSSSAEVDYLLTCGQVIYPVEVKAGKTGSLRSLHVYLEEKQRSFALRLSGALPSLVDATTAVGGRPPRPFRLLSLPLYLVGQIDRIVGHVLN